MYILNLSTNSGYKHHKVFHYSTRILRTLVTRILQHVKKQKGILDVVRSSVRDVGSFERLVRFDSSAGIP